LARTEGSRHSRGQQIRVTKSNHFLEILSVLEGISWPKTSIEWTDATWKSCGGVHGSDRSCTNCYAMRMAARLEAMGTRSTAAPLEKAGVGCLDRENSIGREIVGCSARLVEAAQGFRQLDSDLFHDDVPLNLCSCLGGDEGNSTPHVSDPHKAFLSVWPRF